VLSTPAPPPAIRIRWRILAFLFGFGFLAYVQQKSITVAAEQIMPTLHLSQLQIGWLEQAFVIGYALFQMPGGIFGQRVGARRTFVIIGLAAFLAMIATPVAPALFDGQALFAVLLGAQLLLGVAQAAIFPVSAGVFSAWFPPNRWALVQGLQTMGMQLGAAITPALIASLMVIAGWQKALIWTTLPALGLIGWWAWYGRNTPSEHRGVGAAELREIGDREGGAVDSGITLARVLEVLKDRNALLLFVSYTCMNYVFYLLSNWVFLYLVQERHFSVLESGWLATAPPLAAAVGAGLGGAIAGRLCERYGFRWGYRLVPLVAMPASGLLLVVAIHMANAYLAVAALAACYASVELTEGSYWGAAMTVGGSDAMAVSGFMNTGGNLGGIIGIPIVAYLSGRHLWNTAFFIGVGFAVVSAVCWLGIDADRSVGIAVKERVS
jgi:ACS family glucarate transporter-like MFS transporter